MLSNNSSEGIAMVATRASGGEGAHHGVLDVSFRKPTVSAVRLDHVKTVP